LFAARKEKEKIAALLNAQDRVVDVWIADAAEAFTEALLKWADTDDTLLAWDALEDAIDATEDALFWTLLYSHARGCVDVRDKLGIPAPKADFADFVAVDAVRAALDAAGYSYDVQRGLAFQFGEFASVLATKAGHEVYSRVAQSLGDALGRGETKREWVERNGINSIGVLKDNPHYISNVFRTNQATYYAAGKWHAIKEMPDLKDVVEALEFIAVLDDRTTPVCEGMDGTIKPVDDPIWSTNYPPNHYMCRSTVEPVSKYERVKYKDPTHLHDPAKGFDRNVGKDYAEIIHGINGDLSREGLGSEVAKRQEDIKNRIISSDLLDKG